MKIGIFGGSFDPIHSGHAMIANYAAQWEGLDEVWLMVSPQNPLKSECEQTPEEFRCEMAQLVAMKCNGVSTSRFELGLPKPTYTYRTLCLLREAYPEDQFVLIIGSDNWKLFQKWKDHDKIINEFEILIYPRPGFEMDGEVLRENVRIMESAPQVLMSSTFVREAVKEGKNINFFVPPEVYEYICNHGLYGT